MLAWVRLITCKALHSCQKLHVLLSSHDLVLQLSCSKWMKVAVLAPWVFLEERFGRVSHFLLCDDMQYWT
jgi:hypothetical protein